jgi:branched-subunit amino acid transport protein
VSRFSVALAATVLVGAGTYLIRASFILAFARREIPLHVRAALGYVAPAVLAALVASLLAGAPEPIGWAEVAALAVAGAVGSRTRSLPAVLVAGMTTLWLSRLVF